MDPGRLIGTAVAASAVISGVLVGAGELYRKLAYGSGPQLSGKESDDEEG